MVKTLSEPLPVASSSQSEEIEEELDQEKRRTPNYLQQDHFEQFGTLSPCTFSYVPASDDDSDINEARLFMTPVPSSATSKFAPCQ